MVGRSLEKRRKRGRGVRGDRAVASYGSMYVAGDIACVIVVSPLSGGRIKCRGSQFASAYPGLSRLPPRFRWLIGERCISFLLHARVPPDRLFAHPDRHYVPAHPRHCPDTPPFYRAKLLNRQRSSDKSRASGERLSLPLRRCIIFRK